MSDLSILILDDEARLADELAEYLTRRGYEVHTTYAPADAFPVLEAHSIDILLLDLRLPGMNGLEVLRKVREEHPEVEVIIMTGHGDMDSVIEALRLGAFDFLKKSFRPVDIQAAIERTAKYRLLSQRCDALQQACSHMARDLESAVGTTFVGRSRAVGDVLRLVETTAEHPDTSVLISGESGTGKELVARMIHYRSTRRGGLFCPVNCSAVPRELFESEFFGHTRGAFTGAREERQGYLQAASGGTLFLDEIGDLPQELQAKLLRAIEYKSFTPIGSEREIHTDVRVVAATGQDLARQVEARQFRLDLYHRLNTIEIHLPPLRQRPDDVDALVEYFVRQFALRMNKPVPQLDPEGMERLRQYPFPGNARELRNLVERAMIFSRGKVLRIEPPEASRDAAAVPPVEEPAGGGRRYNLDGLERAAILAALQETTGNRVRAAGLLGITRQALERRMEKHGIRPGA